MSLAAAVDIESLAERWARDGLAARGQVYCSVEGVPRIDSAWGRDGMGAPITRDTEFCVYCAGKPAVAVALCAAQEIGLLALTDTLGAHLDGLPGALASCRVLDILGHRAGLGGSGGFAASLAPPPVRRALALAQSPAPGPHPSSYTEFAGWELLSAVLEAVTGTHIERALDELIGGARGWTAPRVVNVGDVGVSVAWRGERPFPLLGERYVHEPWVNNAAVGWVSSMRTLGRFAEQLLECADGRARADRPGARTVAAHVFAGGEPAWDRTLRRWCRFGHGVMLDLADHYFGEEWGPESFGHSGFAGVTWFAADPRTGVVAAVHLVDIVAPTESVMVRRPRVTRDLVQLLERGR